MTLNLNGSEHVQGNPKQRKLFNSPMSPQLPNPPRHIRRVPKLLPQVASSKEGQCDIHDCLRRHLSSPLATFLDLRQAGRSQSGSLAHDDSIFGTPTEELQTFAVFSAFHRGSRLHHPDREVRLRPTWPCPKALPV